MEITLIKNRFGHVHIFKGNQQGKLTDLGDNVLLNGNESEIYIQIDTDISFIEHSLTKEQRETFNNGFEIVINDLGFFA